MTLHDVREHTGSGLAIPGLRAGFLLFLLGLLLPAVAGAEYPRRIVSLGPLNTRNVFLLGAGEQLIADTSYCKIGRAHV